MITEVQSETKGPQVILSRRDPELIKTLFEIEVPEIADGLVEIRGVAREPGYRSKIAVESHAQGVDPVGACVGPRGSRVAWSCPSCAEKIDIIPWNPEPARFVAKALSPARVRGVPRRRPEGSDGDRSRRPARARDRQGGHERPPRRAADGLEGGHPVRARVRAGRGRGGIRRRRGRRGVLGSLRAILANGKRCPNAALPGTRFCGVPAHQELAKVEAETGTFAEGTVQPVPEVEAAEAEAEGEGEEAPSEEQVAEAGASEETARRGTGHRPVRGQSPGPRRAGGGGAACVVTTPIRTCAGCGRKAPQSELVRFRAADDGQLTTTRGPGRSAYTCRRLACFERAVGRPSTER